MSWDAFAESVTEAQRLAQPEDFDFLHRIGECEATRRNSSTCSAVGCACRQGCARRHRSAARYEQRQRAQDVHRWVDRVYQAALAEAGDNRHRLRPRLLRAVRAVATEEFAALRRHLGARLAPVQGLRGLPCAARDIRQPQAGQRIAAGRGHTRHFAHLKSGDQTKDKTLLLSTILADAINLSQTKSKLGTFATKPMGRSWPIWSTRNSGIHSPSTGATAARHHRTARTSALVAKPRAWATAT